MEVPSLFNIKRSFRYGTLKSLKTLKYFVYQIKLMKETFHLLSYLIHEI